jgi:hypothetical protein
MKGYFNGLLKMTGIHFGQAAKAPGIHEPPMIPTKPIHEEEVVKTQKNPTTKAQRQEGSFKEEKSHKKIEPQRQEKKGSGYKMPLGVNDTLETEAIGEKGVRQEIEKPSPFPTQAIHQEGTTTTKKGSGKKNENNDQHQQWLVEEKVIQVKKVKKGTGKKKPTNTQRHKDSLIIEPSVSASVKKGTGKKKPETLLKEVRQWVSEKPSAKEEMKNPEPVTMVSISETPNLELPLPTAPPIPVMPMEETQEFNLSIGSINVTVTEPPSESGKNSDFIRTTNNIQNHTITPEPQSSRLGRHYIRMRG